MHIVSTNPLTVSYNSFHKTYAAGFWYVILHKQGVYRMLCKYLLTIAFDDMSDTHICEHELSGHTWYQHVYIIYISIYTRVIELTTCLVTFCVLATTRINWVFMNNLTTNNLCNYVLRWAVHSVTYVLCKSSFHVTFGSVSRKIHTAVNSMECGTSWRES